MLFGFLYGLYISVLRSNVMSRKSTTFLLASIVICKLLRLKILYTLFIAFTCLGVFVQVASPSSLNNPTLTSRWVSWDNRNSPTSSQVSAPSKSYLNMNLSPIRFSEPSLRSPFVLKLSSRKSFR